MNEKEEVLKNFDNKIKTTVPFAERGDMGAAEMYEKCYRGLRVYSGKAWYLRLESGFWEADKGGKVKLDIGQTIASFFVHRVPQHVGTHVMNAGEFAKLTAAQTRLLQERGIAATLRLSRSLFHYADGWDEYPSDVLIAVENGVLSKKGILRDPNPTEYARSKAPVIWEGLDTPAPLWEKTISEIFGDNPEIIAFIQRLFGYIVSGQANERLFPVFYGAGANGKSVLVSVLQGVLGKDYSFSTQANALMEAKYTDGRDKPNPYIFNLKGKRLVLAHESKEGQTLDTDLIKTMTGGDNLSARQLYGGEYIEFRPTHTSVLITNNLPQVSVKDQAIWDRMLPIRFNSRFVSKPTKPNEYKIDKDIARKIIRSEKAGVMAWLVRGYFAYQKSGLSTPQAVKNWRDDYRFKKDDFSRWVAARLDTSDPDVKTSASVLYEDYKKWAQNNNLTELKNTPFGSRMAERYTKSRNKKGVLYQGVKI